MIKWRETMEGEAERNRKKSKFLLKKVGRIVIKTLKRRAVTLQGYNVRGTAEKRAKD